MDDVTQILFQIETGDPSVGERLLRLVYEELRRLAAVKLARGHPHQTLQATALVHEAYLRLVDVERAQHWYSRGHFFSAAAEAMRRILVDNARRKEALRRGGDRARENLEQIQPAAPVLSDDLIALDEAMEKLSREEPDKAEVVKLRYFAGLTMEQIAEARGISLGPRGQTLVFVLAANVKQKTRSDPIDLPIELYCLPDLVPFYRRGVLSAIWENCG